MTIDEKYERRIKHITLAGIFVAQMFQPYPVWPRFKIVEGGLPEDAIFVGASYDQLFDKLTLFFFSAEFPPVAEGSPATQHNVLLMQEYPQ